jgi:UTP--glucose-1-phosphate uridylyltransferase
MKITKAIITAAGKAQRNLPLQTIIDRDGQQKSVLNVSIEEILRSGIQDICVVIHPDDEAALKDVAGEHSRYLSFVYQDTPRGYGHAVWLARDFAKGEPFLHLISDHLYVSRTDKGCAQRVLEIALAQSCAVSAVRATRESLLPNFGAISGGRVAGRNDLYTIDTVIEKPTPTEAEQRLVVPGLRAGYYLCFFGIHVLTPAVMEILDDELKQSPNGSLAAISPALHRLAQSERYLALEMNDDRYNLGVKYGLLNAQLALALSGKDRDEVVTILMELLLQREHHKGREA